MHFVFHKVKIKVKNKCHAERENGAISSLEDGFLRFIWFCFYRWK